MNKDFLAYAFYKCARKEYNADGTVFVNERAANFQPLAEWDSLLAIVAFDPSYTVSAYSNKPCGHVGAKDAAGKCLQCTMVRDAARAVRERKRAEKEAQRAARTRELEERDAARAERVRTSEVERERVQGLRDEIGRLEQHSRDVELQIAELQRELARNRVQIRSLYADIGNRGEHHSIVLAGDSRVHARSIGASWYHPTTPCKYCGGFGLRYVANGRCRDCGSGSKR